jgi:hypothetical protein
MVTHSSTSRPVQCLCMAERTTEYTIVTRPWTRLALPGHTVHVTSPEYTVFTHPWTGSALPDHIVNHVP